MIDLGKVRLGEVRRGMIRHGAARRGEIRQGMDYNAYISSPEWKKKRKQRLEIDGHRCRTCHENGTTYTLHIHHATYERFGNEDVKEDLITLCSYCHDAITNATRERRYENEDIEIQNHKSNIPERNNHGMEESEIPLNFRSTSDNAQWRFGKSPKPPGATDKEIKWQAKQNPGRPGTTS